MATDIQLQRLAERLVQNEVVYCVSSLVSTLAAREWDGSDGIDPDDLARLSFRDPDADDYREAMQDRGISTSRIHVGGGCTAAIIVEKVGETWTWLALDTDHDEAGEGVEHTEHDAYRFAFDALGEDHPDGSEVYEHWIVSDFLAAALIDRGESVVRDVAGLTIWGRCTTGQSMALDHVMQQIAVATYGAPAADPSDVMIKVAFDYAGHFGGHSILDASLAGTLEWPRGWECRELDGAGARLVAVFDVDHIPTLDEAGQAQWTLAEYAKSEARSNREA